MSYLLHPTQRKQFTITKGEATALAARLARGENLTFQSYANRNWVAKIARVQFGATVNKFAVKDQLLDPRYTVEASHAPDRGLYNEKHWMTVYKAEPVTLSSPVILPQRTYNTPQRSFTAPYSPSVYDYKNEGNIW